MTAKFSVTASGLAPLHYQWMKNGVPITGATKTSYTTPPATLLDNGAAFAAVVTDSNGSTTSNSGVLTIKVPDLPTISTQPADKSVAAGKAAKFTVVGSGSGLVTYQWLKNGGNILGATSMSYTTPVTTSLDNGSLFSVVLTNNAGSVTSRQATLSVR